VDSVEAAPPERGGPSGRPPPAARPGGGDERGTGGLGRFPLAIDLSRVGGGDPRRRRTILGLACAGTLLGAILAVWAIDMELHQGRVRRNVTLAGRPVGGLAPGALGTVVAELARDYAGSTVEIVPPGNVIKAGAPELGLNLRQDKTVAATLSVGRGGFFLGRFWGWLTSFFGSDGARPVVRVDERSVARVLAERDPGRAAPVEPTIAVEGASIVAVPGRPGRGVVPSAVVEALGEAAPEGLPLSLDVERSPLPPRFTVADAERVAEQAGRVATSGLRLVAGSVVATVPPEMVRGWLAAVPTGEELRLSVNAEAGAVGALLAGANRSAVDAAFAVSDSGVAITPSRTGVRCCAGGAVALIQGALLGGGARDRPLQLPLETILPRRTEQQAEALNVREVVGVFTTNHPAGEPRVRNIHRIADIVRGTVIEPGRTFSLNATAGPRTVAGGFVEAPVIDEKGEFSTGTGGGVSQFATTLFNAAFFAGLDIPGYGMHSLYIARYPYGREATLSYPDLDLKIHNNTSNGVLIWPTYTASSITVTLYSTKTIEGAQTGQTKSPAGVCTSVVTERTRRYLADGRTTVDRFYARYAPEEGVLCR